MDRIEGQPEQTFGTVARIDTAFQVADKIYLPLQYCELYEECSASNALAGHVVVTLDANRSGVLDVQRIKSVFLPLKDVPYTSLPISWHDEEDLLDKQGQPRFIFLQEQLRRPEGTIPVSLHGARTRSTMWGLRKEDTTSLYLVMESSKGGLEGLIYRLEIVEHVERKSWHPLRYIAVPVAGVADAVVGTAGLAVGITFIAASFMVPQ